MQYADIKFNDIANTPGIAVSFYEQGCPFECPGCQNPETWDFNGGQEFTPDTLNAIIKGLKKQNINRTLCILGGEPLCNQNLFLTELIINNVLEVYPDQEMWIWTGYTLEQLLARTDARTNNILNKITGIIDGPFISSAKNIRLKMRGSENQRIIQFKDSQLQLPKETIRYEIKENI